MLQPIKMQYDKSGPRVAEALRRNHFDAYYFSTREEAIEKIMELIPAEGTVSWGGTATVDELGIKELLRERGQNLLDRDTAKDMDERMDIMRRGLLADTFLMSSNAITEGFDAKAAAFLPEQKEMSFERVDILAYGLEQ